MFTSATHDFLENEWRHHRGFLNTARITGYFRRGTGREFFLAQNNLASLALPIVPAAGLDVPDIPDNTPLTVRCHVFGESNMAGHRVAVLAAFEIAQPDPAWLPPDYAFKNPVPDDAIQLDFIPAETGITHDNDGSNLIRVAGFASSIALEGVDVGRAVNGKLSFLLVQADSGYAIPVRCYGRLAAAFADRIEEGTAIQVAASFRVDAKRSATADENGKTIMVFKPYLHAISDPMFAGDGMIPEEEGKAAQEALVKAQPARRRRPAGAPTSAGA